MKQIVKSLHASSRGTALTIGNFDGVHIGHQALLTSLQAIAQQKGLSSAVLLFEPQPGEYFLQKKAPARLFSVREKISALRALGIEKVYCLRFHKKIALMSAVEFIHKYIPSCNAKYVLLGQDFRFGRNREGSLVEFSTFANSLSYEVSVFPDIMQENIRVSSTNIREALRQGNLAYAATHLGKPYTISGRIVQGKGMGKQWGIPTANLNTKRVSWPLAGVFRVRIQRQGEIYYGVANVGTRPTVDGTKQILEVHFFDFQKEIYGERVEVTFLQQLRKEMQFSSVDKLIEQIKQDIAVARSFTPSLHHI